MIQLQANGNSVTFIFTDNQYYLNEGQIEVPLNSLSVIFDESDLVTFRKPDNDIFISARLSDFGMTKEELIQWLRDNFYQLPYVPIEVDSKYILRSGTYDADAGKFVYKNKTGGTVFNVDFDIDDFYSDSEYVWDNTTQTMKLKFFNQKGELVTDHEIFDTNEQGEIIMENRTF